MTKTQNINLAYILGLMEADGGIQLFFGTGKSKTTLKPCIRISQKTNSNLLALIKQWMDQNGIENVYEDWNPNTSRGRAKNLTITKVNSVRKFIELVKKEPLQFISQKQRDFWILDRVLNTPKTLSISDKVNLKKTMHKAHASQPDLDSNGANTREVLELRYNLPLGSSQMDASGILKQIDAKYAAHVKKIQQKIAKGTFRISPEWLAGLIDGDGSYYVTMQVRKPDKRYNDRFIEFQGNFTLSMELNALLTLQAVRSVIGSQAVIKEEDNHYQMWVRNQAEVKTLLEMQCKYVPVGNHRLIQYKLVRDLHDAKESKMMRDLVTIRSLVKASYAISEKSKGRERTHTLDEMLAIVEDIYG